jgi:hypothetical protein
MNYTTLAIFAIVAALGLLGVIAVESISMPQQQAAARGCESSFQHGGGGGAIGFNASQGRCFGH